MIPCPFCHAEMVLLKDGTAGMTCPACHAAWLDGGKLLNVVGKDALARLVENAASDGTLRCSACHKPYRGEACPRCGGAPVTCPGGHGKLATFQLYELALDVCPPCNGVLFDPGELKELRACVAKKPMEAPQEREVLSHFDCEGCDKRVQWRHGFEHDSKLYCGSCAPPGCVSLDTTLTKPTPERAPRVPYPVDLKSPLAPSLGGNLLGIAVSLAWDLVVEDD